MEFQSLFWTGSQVLIEPILWTGYNSLGSWISLVVRLRSGPPEWDFISESSLSVLMVDSTSSGAVVLTKDARLKCQTTVSLLAFCWVSCQEGMSWISMVNHQMKKRREKAWLEMLHLTNHWFVKKKKKIPSASFHRSGTARKWAE